MDTIGILLSRGVITSCDLAGNFKLEPLSYSKNEDGTFVASLSLVSNPKNYTTEELKEWISNELNALSRHLSFIMNVEYTEDPVVFTISSVLK